MPAFVPPGPPGEATGRPWLRGAIVVVLLGASWAATWFLGGAGAPHWYFLPIFATAVWFSPGTVLAAALVATVLAGPLSPDDVAAGTAQPARDWVSRGLSFAVVGLLIAVGHRRAGTLHRRQAEMERRERERAEQKATVVQSVSHEFRSPLTVISGSVPLLRREDLSPEQHAELVDALQGAAARLQQLVDTVLAVADALDTSRAAPLPVLTDLRRLLGDVPTPGGQRRVRVSQRVSEPTVVGHPALVRLALDAAVANALKFSPGDTPVDVVVAREDDWLTVVVRDRGPGVEPAALGRSLPFGRGDAGYPGGASLGLLAARTALQRLGGQLHVRKALGGGGEVELSFPATVGASAARPDELAPQRRLVAPILRAWRRVRTG